MPDLSSNNQNFLLRLARQSIETRLKGEAFSFSSPVPEEVKIPRGCFVTLKKNGMLRGCIGTFEATKPLFENIFHMAQVSAFQDPRFPPVNFSELSQIRIEISVLGPRRKMNSIEELEIGKHGIFIQLGHRRGTYLPEVAVEQGWSAKEFISNCAVEKVGIRPEELERAQIDLYEVEKFLES